MYHVICTAYVRLSVRIRLCGFRISRLSDASGRVIKVR